MVDINLYSYAMVPPGPPFSASDDEKLNSPAISATEVDLADYPLNHEVCGAEVYFQGPWNPSGIVTVTFQAFNNETGQNISDGTLTNNIPTPGSQGHPFWEWYRVRFWIGHVADEIFVPMQIRMEVSISGGGLDPIDQTFFMNVVDSSVEEGGLPQSEQGANYIIEAVGDNEFPNQMTINLLSDPSQATVLLNNSDLGWITPHPNQSVSAPPFTLTFQKDGFDDVVVPMPVRFNGFIVNVNATLPSAAPPPPEEFSYQILPPPPENFPETFVPLYQELDGLLDQGDANAVRQFIIQNALTEGSPIVFLAAIAAIAGVVGIIVTLVGSYPFFAFLVEETLQTLDFAYKTAMDNNDFANAQIALNKKQEILAGGLFNEIADFIPVVNVVNAVVDYVTASQLKVGIDQEAINRQTATAYVNFIPNTSQYEQDAITGQYEVGTVLQYRALLIVNSNAPAMEIEVNGVGQSVEGSLEIEVQGGITTIIAQGAPTADFGSVEKIVTIAPNEIKTVNLFFPASGSETETATLNITSTPTQAKIYVDGIYTFELSPTAITINPGSHEITLKKAGFQDSSENINIENDETQDLDFNLPEIGAPPPPAEEQGTLILAVSPEDTDISVPGQDQINAPGTFTLNQGSYSINVSAEGFESDERTFFINTNQTTNVSIALQEIGVPPPVEEEATITMTSVPTNADVYIDGEYRFTTTPYTTLIDPGLHIFRAQLDGHFPQEIQIILEPGQVLEIPFTLEPIPQDQPQPPPLPPGVPFPPEFPPTPLPPDNIIITDPSQIPGFNFDLLFTPFTSLESIEGAPGAPSGELMINLETTDVLPWKGRIYSIAMLDLSDPQAEIVVLVDEDERALLDAFVKFFNTQNFSTLVGYKLSFDHRFLYSKIMLYRMQSRKFKDINLKDVKQLMDQVKEEFVYFPDRRGTLDDWGRHLFGVGKFSDQETLLRKFIAGDKEFVVAFQKRQIELATNIYALHRFSSMASPTAPISPISEVPLPPETTGAGPREEGAEEKQCKKCIQFNAGDATQCKACGEEF